MKRRIYLTIALISGLTALAAVMSVSPAFATSQTRDIIVDQNAVNEYNTINAALANITDASSTKRYRITVKPGTYSETVTMKEYVDLVGSGQNNTIISSTATTSSPPTSATIIAKDNSKISHLTAINNGITSQGSIFAIAILFVNTTTSAEHVTAKSIGSSDYNNHAIKVYGSLAQVTLDHVTAFAEGGDNENVGIYASSYAYVDINNTQATGVGGSWAAAIGDSSGYANIRNSVLKASGGSYVYTLDCGSSSISSSIIIAEDGTNDTIGSYGCQITYSEIYATASQGTVNAVYGGKVASSLLEGSLGGSAKVVHCWDETFTAITDQ